MSTYNQCESCLKPINSLTDPLCWECQSTVDNANSAGGLNLGNISLPSILLVLASPVIIWLGLMMYLFVIAAYILTASIVPLAFSITSIYLVAPLSGSGFPAIPSSPSCPPLRSYFCGRPSGCCYSSVAGNSSPRSRKGLVFILGYYSLALTTGLVLTYTAARPFSLDMRQAATGIAAALQSNALIIADSLQWHFQMLAPTIRGASELISGINPGPFSVAVVVYCSIFLMETVLFVRLMERRSKKALARRASRS